MITLKAPFKTFNLKTSFSDLTFSEYSELVSQGVDEFRQIEILTGLSPLECEMLDLEMLGEYLGFLKTNPITEIEPSREMLIGEKLFLLPESLGACQYRQKILACESLEEGNLLKTLSVYLEPVLSDSEFNPNNLLETEKKLSQLSVNDAFEGINYILKLLKELIEHENETLKGEQPTPEQIRAGIESFNALGEFNTIDLIAQRYNYTHEQVERLEYDLIYLILLKNNISSRYEKNYSEILSPK